MNLFLGSLVVMHQKNNFQVSINKLLNDELRLSWTSRGSSGGGQGLLTKVWPPQWSLHIKSGPYSTFPPHVLARLDFTHFLVVYLLYSINTLYCSCVCLQFNAWSRFAMTASYTEVETSAICHALKNEDVEFWDVWIYQAE